MSIISNTNGTDSIFSSGSASGGSSPPQPPASNDLAIYVGGLAFGIVGFALACVCAYMMDCFSAPAERRRRAEKEVIMRQHREIREKVLDELFPDKFFEPPEPSEALSPPQQRQEEDEEENPNDCAICLEPLNSGDSVIQGMDCTHIFHRGCVMKWLLKNDNCPKCREAMWDKEAFNQKIYERVEDLRNLLRAGKHVPADLVREVELINLQTGREASNALGSQQNEEGDEEAGNENTNETSTEGNGFTPGAPIVEEDEQQGDEKEEQQDAEGNDQDKEAVEMEEGGKSKPKE